MKPYADSNFLVRLLYEFPESDAAERAISDLAGAGGLLPITWLHRVETLNALHLHVWQSRQPGQVRVTHEQALAATEKFRSAITDRCGLVSASVATGALEERFEELAARHTGRRGFRTYDLLHVASTQLLDCDTFWSFDQKANALASLEGLKVLNPRKSTPRSS
ncbi:MAG: type II toxin-antitoxin system VapC family toxin [Verrucomicrobiota bacterium]